jgi:hypothetical protein
VTLVTVDDLTYLFAVPSDHDAIDLGLDARGQLRRINQVGKEDGQAPDLAVISRGSEQFPGVGVAPIHCQHLPRERISSGPVAAVYRADRLVKQLVDGLLVSTSVHDPIVTRRGVENCDIWANSATKPSQPFGAPPRHRHLRLNLLVMPLQIWGQAEFLNERQPIRPRDRKVGRFIDALTHIARPRKPAVQTPMVSRHPMLSGCAPGMPTTKTGVVDSDEVMPRSSSRPAIWSTDPPKNHGDPYRYR